MSDFPAEIKNTTREICSALIQPMMPNHEIEFLKEADQWRINIVVTPELEKVILGFNNELINALQHYVRIAIHRAYPEDRTHFILDVNTAKKRREQYITETIPKLGEEEVLRDGKSIIFVGLSSYERRLVHGIMVEVKGLETVSVGPQNDRRLILRPTSEAGGSSGIENARVIDINKELMNLTK